MLAQYHCLFPMMRELSALVHTKLLVLMLAKWGRLWMDFW